MSKDAYLLYLRARQKAVDERIREASLRLREGDLRDRVHAAGELATLERRRALVESKLVTARAADPSRYTGLRSEIAEDLDAIGVMLDRLTTGF